MTSLNRILLFFGIWLLQLIFYISFYELGYTIWESLGNEIRNNLGWGITIYFSLYVFIVLSLINSILFTISVRRKWLFILILFVIYEIFFGSNYFHSPFRFLLLSSSVLISFIIPSFILFFLRRKEEPTK